MCYLNDLIDFNEPISLLNCYGVDGNTNLNELVAISALIRKNKPMNLLEIGTFNGNTTLQMALNAPEGATIHTLDLPIGVEETKNTLERSDLKYIRDNNQREERRYYNTTVAHKIQEHEGDSGTYDFSLFTKKRPLDFAFIDGSHSYESVSSDSENVLRILGDGGIVLWHDFTRHWPGVCKYLIELDDRIPLVHIAGTRLIMYHK